MERTGFGFLKLSPKIALTREFVRCSFRAAASFFLFAGMTGTLLDDRMGGASSRIDLISG